jgi:hypothetical protein
VLSAEYHAKLIFMQHSNYEKVNCRNYVISYYGMYISTNNKILKENDSSNNNNNHNNPYST